MRARAQGRALAYAWLGLALHACSEAQPEASAGTGGVSAHADAGANTGGSTGHSTGGAPAASGTGGQSGSAGTTNQDADSSVLDGAVPDSAVPEPGTGIAAQYPGDEGIESDPSVLFADDFESYAQPSDLDQRWDAVYHYEDIRLATETENVYAGAKALEFMVPQQDEELSNATDKLLSPEQDALFLRYYSKFQAPFDVVGSSHNGSSISAHYFIDGQATPGVPADGQNKFLVNLENWRGEAETVSPGPLNVYVYHPEQRSQWGDHYFPTGIVLPNSREPYDFGDEFIARPDLTPELDRWYCYEYMLKANTPGERDGRITVWIDGELVADFPNLRFRDVESLKIDRFGLSFHIGSNPAGETKKWYDNVVAATEYIGPLVPR